MHIQQCTTVLEQCRALSLTARLAIAMHCFEQYCRVQGLAVPEVIELQDYLWEWPLVGGSLAFPAWESRHPVLVDYGLGDPMPERLRAALDARHIDEEEFRLLVTSLVEIIWSSFWAASDDAGSLADLAQVLRISARSRIPLPDPAPFSHSLFAEQHGWGQPLSMAERDAWRQST
jgi:hypothetical protein